MVFPVVMYGYKCWTRKKAECRRIDAFELWCWRRLLRVPWTARRSNQSILKEINPEYSLEGLMLKLKLQYFGYLMWRADSLEKTLMLGNIEGRRRKGWQRMRWLDGITNSTDMGLGGLREWWTGKPGVLRFIGPQSQTWLNNWTELHTKQKGTWQPEKNVCNTYGKRYVFPIERPLKQQDYECSQKRHDEAVHKRRNSNCQKVWKIFRLTSNQIKTN